MSLLHVGNGGVGVLYQVSFDFTKILHKYTIYIHTCTQRIVYIRLLKWIARIIFHFPFSNNNGCSLAPTVYVAPTARPLTESDATAADITSLGKG